MTALRQVLLASAVTALAACASMSGSPGTGRWKKDDLNEALAGPSRPLEDRDRDADRKPAELMQFFGVERGMTAVDLWASGGYVTEVLSITVGPMGKVYAQNPQLLLQYNNGAYSKAIGQRLEGNRLPNVTRIDGDLPGPLAPGSVDVAVTAMNLHDIYNRSPANAEAFLKSVYAVLKPGGVLGLVDHVGVAGADNAKLHRMQKQQAIDVAKAAGFTVAAESNLLAHAADDHTKSPFDPGLRGKTDQFTLLLRKPK